MCSIWCLIDSSTCLQPEIIRQSYHPSTAPRHPTTTPSCRTHHSIPSHPPIINKYRATSSCSSRLRCRVRCLAQLSSRGEAHKLCQNKNWYSGRSEHAQKAGYSILSSTCVRWWFRAASVFFYTECWMEFFFLFLFLCINTAADQVLLQLQRFRKRPVRGQI